MKTNARIKGTVLWYSKRDENGIIVDKNRNEFYFDRSVLNNRGVGEPWIPEYREAVEFVPGKIDGNLNVATKVYSKEIDYGTIEIDGIQEWDAPDYCDAYAASALYLDGEHAEEEDLDEIDRSVIYELVFNHLN